ncbi:hypothetical protein TRIUR3_35275 [Triticum urartu]|uniref:Uncharacterized protein n=1 Tax=Triticum urartu TaxID=4572 RepID=M7YZU4_TRIUA|nr:hypothetical protein TRIUR3_35275 [Triticum urartu]
MGMCPADSLAAGRTRRAGSLAPLPKRVCVFFVDADATESESSGDEEVRRGRRRVRKPEPEEDDADSFNPFASSLTPVLRRAPGEAPRPVDHLYGELSDLASAAPPSKAVEFDWQQPWWDSEPKATEFDWQLPWWESEDFVMPPAASAVSVI